MSGNAKRFINKNGTAPSCGTTVMIVFHIKFNQNRIINEDFKILGKGKLFFSSYANILYIFFFSILSFVSTKIHIKMFHTKCH